MKRCEDCRHHYIDGVKEISMCRVAYFDGDGCPYWTRPYIARFHGRGCGPSAKFFEPRFWVKVRRFLNKA